MNRDLRDGVAGVITEYALNEPNLTLWDLADRILKFMAEEFDRQLEEALGSTKL